MCACWQCWGRSRGGTATTQSPPDARSMPARSHSPHRCCCCCCCSCPLQWPNATPCRRRRSAHSQARGTFPFTAMSKELGKQTQGIWGYHHQQQLHNTGEALHHRGMQGRVLLRPAPHSRIGAAVQQRLYQRHAQLLVAAAAVAATACAGGRRRCEGHRCTAGRNVQRRAPVVILEVLVRPMVQQKLCMAQESEYAVNATCGEGRCLACCNPRRRRPSAAGAS